MNPTLLPRVLLRPTALAVSTTSSLLPFLYQTRSINHTSGPRDKDENIPFEHDSTPAEDPFAYLYQAPEREHLQHLPSRKPQQSYIPLNRPAYNRPSEQRSPASPAVTLREKEIFQEIFQDILAGTGAPGAKRPTSKDARPRTGGLPPPPALTELLTSTIGPQKSGENVSFAPHRPASQQDTRVALASTFANYPPSLRAAAAQAAGIKDWGEVAGDSKLVAALKDELRALPTDVAVLRWMEEKVFVLPADPEAASASSYSELLGEGMDIFSQTYNDLGSSVALFERAKGLGAESYVLGCTTAIYNRTLAAIWDGYANLQRIYDLIEEMQINAVGCDLETVEVLRRICRDVTAAFEGSNGDLAAMMVGHSEMRTVDKLLVLADRAQLTGSFEKVHKVDTSERRTVRKFSFRPVEAVKAKRSTKRFKAEPWKAGLQRGDRHHHNGAPVEGGWGRMVNKARDYYQ